MLKPRQQRMRLLTVVASRDRKWQERAAQIDAMDRYELRALCRDLIDENSHLLRNYAAIISGAGDGTVWN